MYKHFANHHLKLPYQIPDFVIFLLPLLIFFRLSFDSDPLLFNLSFKTSMEGGMIKIDKHSEGYCFLIFIPPKTSTSNITVFSIFQILSISDFNVP